MLWHTCSIWNFFEKINHYSHLGRSRRLDFAALERRQQPHHALRCVADDVVLYVAWPSPQRNAPELLPGSMGNQSSVLYRGERDVFLPLDDKADRREESTHTNSPPSVISSSDSSYGTCGSSSLVSLAGLYAAAPRWLLLLVVAVGNRLQFDIFLVVLLSQLLSSCHFQRCYSVFVCLQQLSHLFLTRVCVYGTGADWQVHKTSLVFISKTNKSCLNTSTFIVSAVVSCSKRYWIKPKRLVWLCENTQQFT